MIPPAPGEKILFIRGGAVGDLILTLPAIRLVRENLPHHHIEILGYPSIAQLAAAWKLADRVTSLDHGGLARFFVPRAKLDPEWSSYFAGFDIVVTYLYDPDRHFGDNLERAGVRRLVAGPHKPSDSGPHASLQLAQVLETIGLDPARIDRRPFALPRPARPATVAIHPGSGSARKNWQLDNWRIVCGAWRASSGADFLVVSGEAEHEWIANFTAMLRDDGVPFEHLDSRPLTEVAERIADCSLFLGHDSGISHLAAGCGVPSVLLFGPTNPDVWAPWQRNAEIIVAPDGDPARLDPGTVLARLQEFVDRQD